jgi:PleD family two-component response regulator
VERIQKLIRKKDIVNITIYAGIVQCNYFERGEELIKSANDILYKSKQESKGK